MSVYELAQKYYPRLWDRERLEALLAAGGPAGGGTAEPGGV